MPPHYRDEHMGDDAKELIVKLQLQEPDVTMLGPGRLRAAHAMPDASHPTSPGKKQEPRKVIVNPEVRVANRAWAIPAVQHASMLCNKRRSTTAAALQQAPPCLLPCTSYTSSQHAHSCSKSIPPAPPIPPHAHSMRPTFTCCGCLQVFAMIQAAAQELDDFQQQVQEQYGFIQPPMDLGRVGTHGGRG